MRQRLRTVSAVAHALGLVFVALALAMFATALVAWLSGEAARALLLGFGLPGLATGIAGLLMWRLTTVEQLDAVEAMLVCALGWILASAVGAVPLMVILDASWIDASFEVVSGFTTTGITMFTGLDSMPRSVLLWRALTQWIGGVGILSLFVAVTRSHALAHRLGATEAHKIRASRPVPGPLRTLQFFALIYLALTVLVALGLLLGGVGWFDAITHAFTTMSTGGFSTHDASIAHWRDPELEGLRPRLIEWVIIAGMAAGGTSFLVHFRLARGELRALWDGAEIRTWIGFLLAVLALLIFEQWLRGAGMFAEPARAVELTHAFGPGWGARIEAGVRTTLFEVLAIATTTGYATADISTEFWGSTARTLFLLLMCVGGCVGSTSGGFKLTRVILLFQIMNRELRRLVLPRAAEVPVVLDHTIIRQDELNRVTALATAWVGILALGTLLTTLLSPHSGWQAFSGINSALNNIGPCYLTIPEMAALSPAVKLTWMLAMLVGRLEVLPLAVLFSPRAWRGVH